MNPLRPWITGLGWGELLNGSGKPNLESPFKAGDLEALIRSSEKVTTRSLEKVEGGVGALQVPMRNLRLITAILILLPQR